MRYGCAVFTLCWSSSVFVHMTRKFLYGNRILVTFFIRHVDHAAKVVGNCAVETDVDYEAQFVVD